jgi:hypothetical protein
MEDSGGIWWSLGCWKGSGEKNMGVKVELQAVGDAADLSFPN